jgi:hypothetical protein
MMNKITIERSQLIKFIKKFYLKGSINSAEITVSNKKISATFYRSSEKLIGKISMPLQQSNVPHKLGVFGIGSFLAMIKSFIARTGKDDKISLECCAIRPFDQSIQKLKISNDKIDMHFFGANLGLINNKSIDISRKTPWDFTGHFEPQAVPEILKGIKAFDILKSKFFIEQHGSQAQIKITDYANSMSLPLPGKAFKTFTTTKRFSLLTLRKMLIENKKSESGSVAILSNRYIKFQFHEDGIISTYMFDMDDKYIVAPDENLLIKNRYKHR